MIKKWNIILLFFLSTFSLSAYSDLRICDVEPIEVPCEIERNSFAVGENIYFTLISDLMWNAPSVTFDVYEVVDTVRGEDKFLASFKIDIGRDWNYCYKSIKMTGKATYRIIAYIGNTYAASAIITAS